MGDFTINSFPVLAPRNEVSSGRNAVGQTHGLPSTQTADHAKTVYKEFEATILETFVETTLPENSETMFGKGLAGSTWKSFLAMEIARKLADAGQIGLARQLSGANSAASERVWPHT